MPQMKKITPFVPVSDITQSIAFFEEALGFSCTFRASDPDYAFLRRDHVAVRLIAADDELNLTGERAQQLIYIDVDDIDGLYSDLKAGLDRLPAGRVRPPFDQAYGQRELHVRDPDVTLILFGQPITTDEPNTPDD